MVTNGARYFQYACFVEDCDRNCSTPQKRRMHLIDKHFFPRDYDFYMVNGGVDRRSSMLRSGRHRRQSSVAPRMAYLEEKTRKRNSIIETNIKSQGGDDASKASQASAPEVRKLLSHEIFPEDADMEGLSGAMSALNFVPPSVRFGHRGRGKARGGFQKNLNS